MVLCFKCFHCVCITEVSSFWDQGNKPRLAPHASWGHAPLSRLPAQTNWCGLMSHGLRSVPPYSPSWPTPPGESLQWNNPLLLLVPLDLVSGIYFWGPSSSRVSRNQPQARELSIQAYKHSSFLSENKVRIQHGSQWQFLFSWPCSLCNWSLWYFHEPNTNKTHLAKCHMALQVTKKILPWKGRSLCMPWACSASAGAFHLCNLLFIIYWRVSPYLSGRENLFILREEKHASIAQICAK